MHASYCCTLFGDSCVSVFFVAGSASEEYRDYPSEKSYPCIDPSGKQPLIIPIQTHVLASALVYCIKTTWFKLLCATVVEPLSSAWPVIATLTRWNPLACVGVDWALMCVLIHACLSCLLLLRVESGLIHREWIRGVWTCPTVCELSVWIRFGKGSGERPCRSTWWVVSLKPSSGTEFCVCDPWNNYYHTLGPEIWPRSTY